MSEALFDLATVEQDSPRLTLLKRHDIQTHHAPHCEEPWLAIPMKMARERFSDEVDCPETEWTDCGSITASIGALLDDHGMVFLGQSKREVEDAALAFALKGGDQ